MQCRVQARETLAPNAVLLSLMLVAPAAMAHDHRHHGAHVHGQANVDLAVDGPVLELALTAPGLGILDFERAPASEAERAALAKALGIFKAGTWVATPAAAGCRREDAQGSAEGFSAAVPAPTDGEHRHAGFTASVRLRCSQPAALRWVDITLPTEFSGLHQVVVNALGPNGQSRSELTACQQRVELAR